MIILKHLTVERFRLLREVSLHFPQRGSILIQGPNEAGKSSLLESIYFALYGDTLIERGKRVLDDLISYGSANAIVTLTVSVSTTELAITRTLERGKGQKITLYVRKLGQPEEGPITRLGIANERIIAEMGRMDGDALRNSCLVEQKGLERLEILHGSVREATVRKLLGMDRLIRISERFKLSPTDEQQLDEAKERLRLAEVQARIPELSVRFETVEAALDAITVLEDLAEIGLQEADSAEQDVELERIASRRQEIKVRQSRVQQLKTADATLGQIVSAYEEMAHARESLPILEKQIEDLERREREELPGREQRVNELSELTRSFGTLQRMSNDLLTAVDTIKELEQDLKYQAEVQEDLVSLKEQIEQAQGRIGETEKALRELEERRRVGRPVLESRLQRLRTLGERLQVLQQIEKQYQHRLGLREQYKANSGQLRQKQKELRETEQEYRLVEAEAQQAKDQATLLESRWRGLSIRRQLEEWLRLKDQTQRLYDAEQHVRAAHQQQETLTQATLDARRAATKYLGIAIVCIVFFFFCGLGALVEGLQHTTITMIWATVAGILALLVAAGAGLSLQNYGKARIQERIADQQMQEAINRVGMMVAAREAVIRVGGNQEDMLKIEREVQNLGGNVPRSLDEVRLLLQQMPDNGESLADIQKKAKAKRDEANAARNQVNVTMEATASLHKECTQLEEARVREGWDTIDELLRADLSTLERLHQEITLLAGQESLPLSSVNARLRRTGIASSGTFAELLSPLTPILPELEEEQLGLPTLDTLVDSTMKATERELAALDGKIDLVTDMMGQLKSHQESLALLLMRKKVIEERHTRYQTSNPLQQLEQAREQQAVLRSALQSLQDSLRQRVKPLGITFGQAAINNAEIAARKQLEELYTALASKLIFQEQREQYIELLKDHQESLAEYYKQLAKFSNTLGSWIVPPNPFADALKALRIRCQHELAEANEVGIIKELDSLQMQEGAYRAKIALCQQEIEDAQHSIAALLVQRHRPMPKSYSYLDLCTIWPLLAEYKAEDREHLEQERVAVEQELLHLEATEAELSSRLHTGGSVIDVLMAHTRLDQQERVYQTKKRGNALVQATSERLLRKIIPRTEYNMQHLLPLITSGRYHDVHLTTEEEAGSISGGPFILRVWDTAAGAYVFKSALSGGAADQLSLALRLAFAIAVLPRELTAAPGILILDEPLSSFDRARAQALADALAGELVSQHFEQILLISHSSAFDPAMFPYHVYLDNGLVVESNLPVVQAVTHRATPMPIGSPEDELDGGETLHIAALPA